MRRLLPLIAPWLFLALGVTAHAAGLSLGVVPQTAPAAPFFLVAGPNSMANPFPSTTVGGGASDSNYTETTSRFHAQMGNCSPTALRFLFVNGGYAQGSASGAWVTAGFGNSATFEAAIEYPIGVTTTRLTFGGQSTIAVASGSFAMSDTVTSPVIPALGSFMVRVRIQVASGAVWFTAWAPIWTDGTNYEGVTEDAAGIDQTTGTGQLTQQAGGTMPVTGATARMGIGQIAILGNVANCKSSLLVGASEISGQDENATCSGAPLYLCGIVARGLTDGSGNIYPFIRASKGTWRSSDFCTGADLDCALLPYVKNMFAGLWSNDFDGSRSPTYTAVQSEGYITAIAATAIESGVRFFPGLLPPSASSTDQFETYANQTQSWLVGGAGDTLVQWLLAGNPAGVYAVMDNAIGNPGGSVTGLADPSNRYLFYVNGTAYYVTGPTSPGLHPNGQGYAQGATDVSLNRVPQLQ